MIKVKVTKGCSIALDLTALVKAREEARARGERPPAVHLIGR